MCVRNRIHQFKRADADGSSLFSLNTIIRRTIQQHQVVELFVVIGNL